MLPESRITMNQTKPPLSTDMAIAFSSQPKAEKVSSLLFWLVVVMLGEVLTPFSYRHVSITIYFHLYVDTDCIPVLLPALTARAEQLRIVSGYQDFPTIFGA